MQIGDTLVVYRDYPRISLSFLVDVVRGHRNSVYDVRCTRCSQRSVLTLTGETIYEDSTGRHRVEIDELRSNLLSSQLRGHRIQCWTTSYVTSTVTVTGTTGTTGPGYTDRDRRSNRSPVRSYGDILKDKLTNKKKKKKIKLPEFRLIRDD